MQVQYLFKKNKCSIGYYNYVTKFALKKLRRYSARIHQNVSSEEQVILASQQNLRQQLNRCHALVMQQQALIRDYIAHTTGKSNESLLQRITELQHILAHVQ